MVSLYRALIRSVTDYAMKVYFNPNTRKQIELIQNQALRLCIGAMKSTPIISLQHTCNELPPHLRHVQICLNYRAHLLTFNSHPNSIVISDTWYDWFPNINNYESFNLQTNKFFADFLEQNGLSNNVFTNYLTNLSLPPWTFEPMSTDFYFLSFIFDKANTAANKQIFLEYVVNNYKDYLHVYTDGSKTQHGTSAAFMLTGLM